MKRFVGALIGLKLWLLLVFATLFFSNSPVESKISTFPTEPTPAPTNLEKISRETSEPYTGDLSIFEDAARDNNLQIDRVLDILKVTSGKSVADIGAGSGWFTVRAARRVGATGQIFAVEINQDFVEHINRRTKDEGLKNVKAILGKPDDPTLPLNTVDAVMILKTYHEIAEPIELMKKIKSALKKGGLVAIIDRDGNGADHGLDEATVIKELQIAGYSLKEKYDFVKPDGMDYFLVFEAQK